MASRIALDEVGAAGKMLTMCVEGEITHKSIIYASIRQYLEN